MEDNERLVVDDDRIPLLKIDKNVTTTATTTTITDYQALCPNDNKIHNDSRKICKCTIFKTKLDGGYSWLITISSFFVQFLLLGFMNNVSSLNSLWVDEFHVTPGIVGIFISHTLFYVCFIFLLAWIGSINMGCMFLSAPFAALLDKKLGSQATGIIGCIISVSGLLVASFSPNFYILLLSYGILFGFGASCCFFSSILIQAKYFDKRLALSNGIVTAGSGAGTLAISTITHSFYTKFGWRNGIRYYSIVYLFLVTLKLFYNDSVVNIRICKPDKNDTRRNKIHISPYLWIRSTASDLCPLNLLKNVPFLIFNISCVFFMMGYFVPYIHLVFYAEHKGIDEQHANYLIGYMAISSLFGKLITGKIAEIPKVSPLFLMIVSFIAIGLSHIMATMAKNISHFIAYSVIFGLFDGSYSCLVTVVVCEIIGRNQLGAGIGLLFGIKSIPLMLGGPFAGFLFDYSKSYFLPFLISGVFVFIAVYLMLAIPIYNIYRKKNIFKYIAVSFNASLDNNNNTLDSLYLNTNNRSLDMDHEMHSIIPLSYPTLEKANSCGDYATPTNTFNEISKDMDSINNTFNMESVLSAEQEDHPYDYSTDGTLKENSE